MFNMSRILRPVGRASLTYRILLRPPVLRYSRPSSVAKADALGEREYGRTCFACAVIG